MIPAGDIRAFLKANPRAVRAELSQALGSTPRERGAWMLVGEHGTFQTIGGGRIELMAVERARLMLRDAIEADRLALPLGPEIGQCCGGRVEITLSLLDRRLLETCVRQTDTAQAARPHTFLFGAGHVGRALAQALALLPLNMTIVDSRRDELEKLPAGMDTRLTAIPEALVDAAPPGSAFAVLTHDHALDFLLVSAALARPDAAYVGMIGSKSKRARFCSWYLANGGDPGRLDALVCPIGRPAAKDKRPEVIAAFAAAEIMAALLAAAATGETAARAAGGVCAPVARRRGRGA